jgi:hypothetical protein
MNTTTWSMPHVVGSGNSPKPGSCANVGAMIERALHPLREYCHL